MKGIFFAASVLGLTVSAPAQGLIALDNDSANPNATPTSTSGGLFFIGPGDHPVKISGDFNAAFYGGTDSANLVLFASFSGAAAVGSSFFGDGTWTDPTGKTYVVPGLENAPANSSGTAWFKVEAWTGPFSSFAAALAGNATAAGFSPPFQNPWASLPNLTPDLSGMPSICMCIIPEPGTFALTSLGAISFLLFLRKASNTTKNSAPVGKESTDNANWCE